MSDRYLLDTDTVSAGRKPLANPLVRLFVESVEVSSLYVSVLTIGELRKGAEMKNRPLNLEAWIAATETSFAGRILPVTQEIATVWGRLSAGRTRPVVDTLLAATAIVHGMTLVTRNVKDMVGTGAVIVNPWNAV